MSGMTISKSYAVLVGLEAYGNFRKGRKKTREARQDVRKKVKGIDTGKGNENAVMHDSADVQMKQAKEEERLREDNKTALGFMRKCKFALCEGMRSGADTALERVLIGIVRIRPREPMVETG